MSDKQSRIANYIALTVSIQFLFVAMKLMKWVTWSWGFVLLPILSPCFVIIVAAFGCLFCSCKKADEEAEQRIKDLKILVMENDKNADRKQ